MKAAKESATGAMRRAVIATVLFSFGGVASRVVFAARPVASDCVARFDWAAPGALATDSPETRVRELARLIVEAYSDALKAGVVRLEEVDELALALDGAPIEVMWRLPGLDGRHVSARQALREQLADNLRPAFESEYFEPAQRAEIVTEVARELREAARARREMREEARRTVETVREITERVSIGADGVEHVWWRVTDPEIVAKLGESWQDESGMIWGDIVKNDDQSIRYMTQYEALAYCESIGAELPGHEDFVRLRESMSATTAASQSQGTGYRPQVLPNLGYFFWSASVCRDNGAFAYDFSGRSGVIDYGNRVNGVINAVRCVARR